MTKPHEGERIVSFLARPGDARHRECRRISGLEKAIGLRLLHRTTRQIEPTEAGQLYFERCKRIVAEARLAHEQLGEMVAQPSLGTRFVFTGG